MAEMDKKWVQEFNIDPNLRARVCQWIDVLNSNAVGGVVPVTTINWRRTDAMWTSAVQAAPVVTCNGIAGRVYGPTTFTEHTLQRITINNSVVQAGDIVLTQIKNWSQPATVVVQTWTYVGNGQIIQAVVPKKDTGNWASASPQTWDFGLDFLIMRPA